VVGIRLEGRLGNQLFQCAFILAVSKRVGAQFFVDQYVEPSVVDKYFAGIKGKSGINSLATRGVSRVFRIKGFKNIFSFYLRRFFYRGFALVTGFPLMEYDYQARVEETSVQDNCIYHGYFQSEKFFKAFEGLIRERFVLKDLYINRFQQKFGGFYKENRVVTIHIRRTDYQNLGHLELGSKDLSLPLNYYKNAISKFDGQNVQFVFISDDRNFVVENFKEIPNKTISEDDEITDFQHLLNADACIISNSTFSWWGAWLNEKRGKLIYAPRYFMGWRVKEETPAGIYPDDWNLIDFSY